MKKNFIISGLCLLIAICLLNIYYFFFRKATDVSSNNNFNIVLITIDTLRADHLSCYGYHRKTSPAIDKIAEQGIIFKNITAPSSWTPPSMASLFTSVYPVNHGVVHGTIYARWTQYEREVFSDDLTTLAEILRDQGYATFGVASNLNLSEKFGFARGFDYFKCLSWVPAHFVNDILYAWENEIKKTDKYFLWIHYFDPHVPYLARKPWIERYASKKSTRKHDFSGKQINDLTRLIPDLKNDPQALADLVAHYDSEINYVDSYIGELIKKFGLTKNTLVVITSDHGEEFLEHGRLGHGNNLYQETIHVPLIIKLPHNSSGQTVDENFSLIDVTPTILGILNIAPPEHMLGKSLLKKVVPLNTFAELDTNSNLKSLVTAEWKYIYNYSDDSEQLYNVMSDRLELNNLAAENFEQQVRLKEQLFEWVKTAKRHPPKKKFYKLSAEEKEKLKSLGYLQ